MKSTLVVANDCRQGRIGSVGSIARDTLFGVINTLELNRDDGCTPFVNVPNDTKWYSLKWFIIRILPQLKNYLHCLANKIKSNMQPLKTVWKHFMNKGGKLYNTSDGRKKVGYVTIHYTISNMKNNRWVLWCSGLSYSLGYLHPRLEYGFSYQPLCFCQLPANVSWETTDHNLSTLGPCHPHGSPRWSSSLLGLIWSSSSCCRYLGNQPTGGRYPSLAPSLCLSNG